MMLALVVGVVWFALACAVGVPVGRFLKGIER